MSFLERAVRKENSLSHLCPKTTHVLISVNYATFGAESLKGSGWPLLNHSIPVAFPCYILSHETTLKTLDLLQLVTLRSPKCHNAYFCYFESISNPHSENK